MATAEGAWERRNKGLRVLPLLGKQWPGHAAPLPRARQGRWEPTASFLMDRTTPRGHRGLREQGLPRATGPHTPDTALESARVPGAELMRASRPVSWEVVARIHKLLPQGPTREGAR